MKGKVIEYKVFKLLRKIKTILREVDPEMTCEIRVMRTKAYLELNKDA